MHVQCTCIQTTYIQVIFHGDIIVPGKSMDLTVTYHAAKKIITKK